MAIERQIECHVIGEAPAADLACRFHNDDFAVGHAHGAAGKGYGRDHRQQFRREAHRQRHGEQQRIQHRPAEHHARCQHDNHESKGQPCDHQSEFAQVTLERRGDLGLRQGRCRGSEHRGTPGFDRDGDRISGLRHGSAKQRVRGVVGVRRGDGAAAFLHRVGLAGQGRFACRESGAFDNQRVGWNDIAGPDAKDISGNDLLHLDLPEHSVAFDLGLEGY